MSTRVRTLVHSVRDIAASDLDDGDIAWTLHVYRCRPQLAWCLRTLRRVYPRSRVTLIVDGDDEPYEDLALRFGCTLVRGQHWFTLETCHLYVERLLTSMASGPEPYTIKIDPDTKVWRRFRRLPGYSCVFGTLETATEHRRDEVQGAANVQGGCIGATRDAVVAILGSGILNHRSCAVEYSRTWARCGDMMSVASRGRFCDDFVISWAAHALDLPIVESAEIRSRWRRTVDNTDLQYAVTHPHKLLQGGP
jgi:hypothetical protein